MPPATGIRRERKASRHSNKSVPPHHHDLATAAKALFDEMLAAYLSEMPPFVRNAYAADLSLSDEVWPGGPSRDAILSSMIGCGEEASLLASEVTELVGRVEELISHAPGQFAQLRTLLRLSAAFNYACSNMLPRLEREQFRRVRNLVDSAVLLVGSNLFYKRAVPELLKTIQLLKSNPPRPCTLLPTTQGSSSAQPAIVS